MTKAGAVECPNCGARVKTRMTMCRSCGRVPQYFRPESSQEGAPDPQRPSRGPNSIEGEVLCPNGHSNPVGQTFCGQCGAPVSSWCPNGHSNPSGQPYCGKCGAPIASAPQTAIPEIAKRLRTRTAYVVGGALAATLIAAAGIMFLMSNDREVPQSELRVPSVAPSPALSEADSCVQAVLIELERSYVPGQVAQASPDFLATYGINSPEWRAFERTLGQFLPVVFQEGMSHALQVIEPAVRTQCESGHRQIDSGEGGYSLEFRSSFLSSCEESSGGQTAYCECALNYLEMNGPADENQITVEDQQAAIQACNR